MPSPSDEDWQYSRIAELDLGAYDSAATSRTSELARAEAARFLAGFEDASLIRRSADAARYAIDLVPQAVAAGVRVTSVLERDAAPDGFGELVPGADHALVRLADAIAEDALVIEIPEDAVIAAPIVVVHELGAGSGEVVAPRTYVRVGSGAQASVVELLVSGDGPMLVLPVTECDLAEGARLRLHSVQQLGRAAWQFGSQVSRVGRDARLVALLAAFGGDYARSATHSAALGPGAESELAAIYLADGHQVQDLRTFQEHVAPQTRSNLVFKGAVADTARSVYTGLIHMHRGARKADAAQTNRNLVLSEGADAFSVPNLDIEENDVRCSHASAVGPIDDEQCFYLESRGVPPQVARRLILIGFFEELLASSSEPAVAEYLRDVITQRLLPVSGAAHDGAAA